MLPLPSLLLNREGCKHRARRPFSSIPDGCGVWGQRETGRVPRVVPDKGKDTSLDPGSTGHSAQEPGSVRTGRLCPEEAQSLLWGALPALSNVWQCYPAICSLVTSSLDHLVDLSPGFLASTQPHGLELCCAVWEPQAIRLRGFRICNMGRGGQPQKGRVGSPRMRGLKAGHWKDWSVSSSCMYTYLHMYMPCLHTCICV